jgi:hypothetical protein
MKKQRPSKTPDPGQRRKHKRGREDKGSPTSSFATAASPLEKLATNEESTPIGSFLFQVVTEDQIQLRTKAFSERLSELQSLHGQLADLTVSAKQFRQAPEKLQQHALLIHATLEGTIDGHNPDLWPDWHSRTRLLEETAQCLCSLNKILLVWQFLNDGSLFPVVLEALYRILELERSDDRYNEPLHFLEQSVWEHCLPKMQLEIEVITARLSLEAEPERKHETHNSADTVSFGGTIFRIDKVKQRISRIESSLAGCATADFGNKRETDSWRVAEALIRACGEKVNVQELAPQLEGNSCRALIDRLRLNFMTIRVELVWARGFKSHWRAEVERV